MRDYARVSPRFWNGPTGKEIRNRGSDAVVVAVYVMTAPSSNMIGLYYLPISTIAHDTGLTIEGASEALRRVCSTGFAAYDDVDEVVWVPEMGAHQTGPTLHPKDKQVIGVKRIAEQHRKSIFFQAFMERYKGAYNLPDLEPVGRGLEAPWKPLRCQEKEQEQEKDHKTLSLPFGSGWAGDSPPPSTVKKPKNGHSRKKGSKGEEDTTPLPFSIPAALEALTTRCSRVVPPADFGSRHGKIVKELVLAFPNLEVWNLVGDWLAAGGVVYMSFIGLDCLKKNFGTWVPVSQQWEREGRKPLTRRMSSTPRRGLRLGDA
jgi:hypothetical protein